MIINKKKTVVIAVNDAPANLPQTASPIAIVKTTGYVTFSTAFLATSVHCRKTSTNHALHVQKWGKKLSLKEKL